MMGLSGFILSQVYFTTFSLPTIPASKCPAMSHRIWYSPGSLGAVKLVFTDSPGGTFGTDQYIEDVSASSKWVSTSWPACMMTKLCVVAPLLVMSSEIG